MARWKNEIGGAERVTDVSFLLDDGTGHVDCNRWYHNFLMLNCLHGDITEKHEGDFEKSKTS